MKSFLPKDPGDGRAWHIIDAADKPVGRVAVQVANILRGKNLPTYSPQVDMGGFVVVINAKKVKFSGRKEEQKSYKSYSRWPGGFKRTPVAMVRERHPDRIISMAVKGMLPKNTLARKMFTRLKIYAGDVHPHAAQGPVNVVVA
ncbi:MAG: 50S ribosomal protein L13 [Verrucomicrobia bacterium]|nr:50S ribosomal protein L13 [Verrucomicrobiota bacterium]